MENERHQITLYDLRKLWRASYERSLKLAKAGLKDPGEACYRAALEDVAGLMWPGYGKSICDYREVGR